MSSNNSRSCSTFSRGTGLWQQLFVSGQNPVVMLLLSAIVGALAGLLATTLELAVNYLAALRLWVVHSDLPTINGYLLVLLVSGIFTGIAFVLVSLVAPETKGSGIQDIEGILGGVCIMRWRRVVPVKYFGGITALGSGMVLGPEGPSVQMGGGIGQMIYDLFRRNNQAEADILIAAGSAAGLAAAFNAPLASAVFIFEEMRKEFNYNQVSVKSVIMGVIASTIVYRLLRGQEVMIPMPVFASASLESLILFFVFGGILGLGGLLFNYLVLRFLDIFDRLTANKWYRSLIIGAVLGMVFSALAILVPILAGDGMRFIPGLAPGNLGVPLLLLLFCVRLLVTMVCFCSGAPGGSFATTLTLGALLGSAFGVICAALFPGLELEPAMFAIAGMSGLFAASVRAPITGLLLVVELTGSYTLILPLLFTVLGATLVAQLLGGQSIYSLLLRRTLDKKPHKAPTGSQSDLNRKIQ